MPTELLQIFLLLQGARILSPQGKVLWSNFAEFVKNCWGGITHSLRNADVRSFFHPWSLCLEITPDRSWGMTLLVWDFQDHSSCHAEPTYKVQPALPPRQDIPRAQKKHTDLQPSSSRGITLTVVVFCRGQVLAQHSRKLLSGFWCYNTDLIYHKCKHCSQDLRRNQSSDFQYLWESDASENPVFGSWL